MKDVESISHVIELERGHRSWHSSTVFDVTSQSMYMQETPTLKTQSIKKIEKGGCIPHFLGPLGPPPSLKKGGLTPKHLKKRGSSKKKRDENFSIFWKQQTAFCNYIFKVKRTFSKDPEHPKIPRPGILSDLCRNVTLISV